MTNHPPVAIPEAEPASPARLRLRLLHVMNPSAMSGQARTVLAAIPFRLQLGVDLEPAAGVADEGPFEVHAVVQAKRLGGSVAQLGESAGVVAGPGRTILELRSPGLPSGVYRLEAAARLLAANAHPLCGSTGCWTGRSSMSSNEASESLTPIA